MSTASATHSRRRGHSPARGPRTLSASAGPRQGPAAPTNLFDGLRRMIDSWEQSTLPRQPLTARAEHGCDCGCGGGGCNCRGDCGCGGGHRDKDCGCGGGHRDTAYGCGGGQRDKDCACEDTCSEDSCACTCCVADADLVVYGRVGERRVVPITVVNERRRERVVELDLGEFRTAGGGAVPVSGSISTTKMTLAPCQEEQAVLTIDITLTDNDRQATDVDDCTTAYADLRMTGCDTRPVRIAVVLLPRVCNVYRVRCGLGCC